MATVLVIDDVEYVRASIVRILSKEGHTLIEAQNGKEGLEILQKSPVDVLILDVVMPEMGGVEMLIKVKSQFPHIKTIFITGHVPKNSNAFATLSTTYGVKKILFKPFKGEELLSLVKELLAE